MRIYLQADKRKIINQWLMNAIVTCVKKQKKIRSKKERKPISVSLKETISRADIQKKAP